MNNQEVEEFEGHLKLFLFSLACVEVDWGELNVCNYMYLSFRTCYVGFFFCWLRLLFGNWLVKNEFYCNHEPPDLRRQTKIRTRKSFERVFFKSNERLSSLGLLPLPLSVIHSLVHERKEFSLPWMLKARGWLSCAVLRAISQIFRSHFSFYRSWYRFFLKYFGFSLLSRLAVFFLVVLMIIHFQGLFTCSLEKTKKREATKMCVCLSIYVKSEV